MRLEDIFDFIGNPVLATTATAITAVVLALLIHTIATAILRRVIQRHTTYLHVFLKGAVAPTRLLLPMLALQGVWAAAPDDFPWLSFWRHGTLVLIIVALTWLAVNALLGVRDVVMLRFPADTKDNLVARRVLTQTTVLMRTLAGLVILLGISAALMTFPDVRQVGASLLASAGLAGLVVGFAAKPVLGNIIAGVQIAVAQPIRIDDVVIVEGEWGRIEEITGSYVVIKIWDWRRLIVPLQWFIENPFQNWTRSSSQLIGSVFLWVDYRLPLEPLRKELERICKAAPEWDKNVCVLQVTDASEHSMQVRMLVSTVDSGSGWDLRCRVREGLIGFIQRDYPDALPHLRAQIIESPPVHTEHAVSDGTIDDKATAIGRATPDVPPHAPPPPVNQGKAV